MEKFDILIMTIVLILWVNIFQETDHYFFREGDGGSLGKLMEKIVQGKQWGKLSKCFLVQFKVKKKNNAPENAHSSLSLKKEMVCPLAGVRWIGNL